MLTDSLLHDLLAALPDDTASARQIFGQIEFKDWTNFLDRAERHGLLGILEAHLDPTLMPPELWKSQLLKRSAQVLEQRELAEALREVVRHLQAAGVRVCALKGPVLAARLYDDPTIRVSTDLDLLVSPGDLERATQVLREQGYAGGSETTISYLLRHSHHLDLTKPGAPPVELHFQSYVGFGVKMPAEALMARASVYQFSDDCALLIPQPEDELIYLAVHAAGHSFVRLAWLYDMKLLIRRHPLDWKEVAARSRASGLSSAVGYAVKLLVNWLRLPLQEPIGKFRRYGVRTLGADAMLAVASSVTDRSALGNLKGLLFTACLCDRTASSAWLLQHHLLRFARRRAYRINPNLVPGSWAG